MGCRALLQGIFPTQGSNLRLRDSCTVDRFFTTEPPGKPKSNRNLLFLLFPKVGWLFPLLFPLGPSPWLHLAGRQSGWNTSWPCSHVSFLTLAIGSSSVLSHMASHPPVGQTSFLVSGSTPRGQSRSPNATRSLSSECTRYHFCHLLLTKARSPDQPRFNTFEKRVSTMAELHFPTACLM